MYTKCGKSIRKKKVTNLAYLGKIISLSARAFAGALSTFLRPFAVGGSICSKDNTAHVSLSHKLFSFSVSSCSSDSGKVVTVLYTENIFSAYFSKNL